MIIITIGANDLGWTDFLNDGLSFCLVSTNFWDWIKQKRACISIELEEQIRNLVKARPNVSILLTELYNPVNKESPGLLSFCKDNLGVMTPYDETEYAVTELNLAYDDVWVKLGEPKWMRVVPLNVIFDKHNAPSPVCGKGPPVLLGTWIQYPGDFSSNSNPLPFFSAATGLYGDCFHPREQGAEAIAEQLTKYMPMVGK